MLARTQCRTELTDCTILLPTNPFLGQAAPVHLAYLLTAATPIQYLGFSLLVADELPPQVVRCWQGKENEVPPSFSI